MLKKGFLGTLSDWVQETLAEQYPRDMERAAKTFDLERYQPQNEEEAGKLIGMFSEWNVYDRKHQSFGHKTGLEYFLEHNPLSLSEDEMAAYRDLRAFEVGLFEVKRVDQARGVLLESLSTGKEFFMHDINTSFDVKPEMTLWTRVAPVSGLYHSVGCVVITLPMTMLSGMRAAIQEWKKNSMTPKEMASWIITKSALQTPAPIQAESPQRDTCEGAKERFEKALYACGMSIFFTQERFIAWLNDEKKYGTGFATKVLFFLAPENCNEKKHMALIDAGNRYMNCVPRDALSGQTPNERKDTDSRFGEQVDMNIYSYETYAPLYTRAHELMRSGQAVAAYKAFAEAITTLHEDRVPLFSCFRIFTNAAICCFQAGFPGGEAEKNQERWITLGEAILRAALRINPRYDFGIATRQKFVDPYRELGNVSQKRRGASEEDLRYFDARGDRRYARTPFAKYERFLKDAGISLSHKTHTDPTIFRIKK